jgi:hypothetical protein
MDRRRTKEDKEIYTMARPFLQLTNSEYQEEFIKGLLGMCNSLLQALPRAVLLADFAVCHWIDAAEKAIRARIELLQEYRKQGICNLIDGENYENEKKRRVCTKSIVAIACASECLFVCVACCAPVHFTDEPNGDTGTGSIDTKSA